MNHKTKIWLLIFTIVLQFKRPVFSKFCTNSLLTQSYIDMSKQKYFIDKSLLLQNIFEKYCFSYLYITAPKGFGKTTIANMIHFFAQAELNSTNQLKHFRYTVAYKFFKNKKISRSKKILEKHLSRYQIIRLDLGINIPIRKNITEEIILKIITTRIQKCFQEYKWILQIARRRRISYFGTKHAKSMITYIEKAMSGKLVPDEATDGLLILSMILNIHFRKPVIIIIDNYDSIAERFVHKSEFIKNIYTFIDRILHDTFETGEENVYLGFIFATSGLSMGKIKEVKIPEYAIIGGDYPELEQRQRMYRFAFLDDHIFTPYFGFSENDLIVLNRKYYSTEVEKKFIKENYNGYMATTQLLFYNSFSTIRYFTNKMKNLNSTPILKPNDGISQFDEFTSINFFIKKNIIREKILKLILYDKLNFKIEKSYEKKIYLHEFLNADSKISTSHLTSQIFTYLFEHGYLTHTIYPDCLSIPNLQIRHHLLKRIQFNYEKMNIDIKQCSDVIQEIFVYQGDNMKLLEVQLKQQLQREFSKVIESSDIPKILEHRAIAYAAVFNTKYRVNGGIVFETSTDENKSTQILLMNLQNQQAMVVEINKGNEVNKNESKVNYNYPNITRVRFLTINVQETGPTVFIRD